MINAGEECCSGRLRQEVRLTSAEANEVASRITDEILNLPEAAKQQLRDVSPVDLAKRLEELNAFQLWAEHSVTKKSGGAPATVPAEMIRRAAHRGRIIVQNYLCLTYLKDACFEIIADVATNRSDSKRCARYLTTGRVRDFRNAFAHANWSYKEDFTGLDCWVFKNYQDRSLGFRHVSVLQEDLDFWHTLSRGVAYAVFPLLGTSEATVAEQVQGRPAERKE